MTTTLRRHLSWLKAVVCAASGLLLFGGMSAEGAELLGVDMSDPAIKEFRERPSISAYASSELVTAVRGLKVPVLDLTQRPAFPTFGVNSFSEARLSFSADDEQKLWYSITREYKQPKVSITISADLRVQGHIEAPTGVKSPTQIEVFPASEPPSKDEDYIAAQINMYRFPNIPYVIDVECNPSSREVCSNKEFLSKLPESVGLIAVP